MTIDPTAIIQLMQRPKWSPMPPVKILKRLKLSGDLLGELETTLAALEAAGIVRKKRDGSVTLRKGAGFVTGVIEFTRKGAGFVRPDTTGTPDIYIERTGIDVALEGDQVVVALAGRRSYRGRSPAGRVVLILKRARQHVVGTYERWRKRGYVVAEPTVLGREISIPKDRAGDAQVGHKVLVKLGDRLDCLTGAVERVLGDPDDPASDIEVIIAEHDLPREFPQKVIDEVERFSERLSPVDVADRTDLRKELIITIDPEDARDFDDAISLKHDNHRWELGVHIADVSHFVRPGSATWTEAVRRGTSTYLPGHTIHMLPEKLSAELCSLRPDEDHLTKSAFISFDETGHPGKVRLERSVIRSAARLTYEQAADVIEGRSTNLSSGIVTLLKNAHGLAGLLRKVRMDRGALELELPEVKALLDDDGTVTGAQLYQRLPSHVLIEEFMIAANEAVARTMFKRSLPLVSRVHEDPDERDLRDLFAFAKTLGLSVGKDYSRKALQKLLWKVTDTPLEYAVHLVALRTFKRAEYSAKARGHYALAAADYCHFTSPIRRFPDLIIGSVLDAGFFKCTDKPFDRESWMSQLGGWCVSSGKLERRAEAAERELNKLKLLRFLQNRIDTVMSGTVISVVAFGAFVELDDIPVEGLIRLSELKDDYYAFDPRAHTLVGRRRGKRIRLGDRLRVRIREIDLARRELDVVPAGRKR